MYNINYHDAYHVSIIIGDDPLTGWIFKMEESVFGAIESAAGCINGDLKKTVFRQCLKLVNSDILNQEDAVGFSCSAIFVATAYQESTEDEKKALSKIIDELLMMPKLVESANLFWKRGQFFVIHVWWARRRVAIKPRLHY